LRGDGYPPAKVKSKKILSPMTICNKQNTTTSKKRKQPFGKELQGLEACSV